MKHTQLHNARKLNTHVFINIQSEMGQEQFQKMKLVVAQKIK
jgi:hypothetical protein